MPYNFIAESFHTGVTAEALRQTIERKTACDGQTDGQKSHHNTASALHAAR